MSIYFDIFNPLRKWKEGDYPLLPQVAISLATYRKESSGAITIGPYLSTEKEIDHAIDFIISELEAARKKAKLELKNILNKQLKK